MALKSTSERATRSPTRRALGCLRLAGQHGRRGRARSSRRAAHRQEAGESAQGQLQQKKRNRADNCNERMLRSTALSNASNRRATALGLPQEATTHIRVNRAQYAEREERHCASDLVLAPQEAVDQPEQQLVRLAHAGPADKKEDKFPDAGKRRWRYLPGKR
jgi:hypothetical protein